MLAEEVALALERLRGALGRARQAAGPDRPLVLSCEPTFLMRWLIPRLGGLQEAIGTQRELRLVSAGGSVPFAREGIDLAIRRADFDMGADVVAEPFCRSTWVPSAGLHLRRRWHAPGRWAACCCTRHRARTHGGIGAS